MNEILSRLSDDQRKALEWAAAVCHAANAEYCRRIGDPSQPAWDDAPEWQRESAMLGVLHVVEHPLEGPEKSHESWLAVKKADGWVYGAVKDPERKTHPCMVPYAELHESQRLKDRVFLGVARALLPALARAFGTRPEVTQDDVDGLYARSRMRLTAVGARTDAVCAELPCGFEIVVSGPRFDLESGTQDTANIVLTHKIMDRIRDLEAYRLQHMMGE